MMKKKGIYRNGKFMYPDDSGMIICTDSLDSYEIEKSQNAIIETSYRAKYGDILARMIIDELKQINMLLHEKSDDGYGHAFEVFSISAIFGSTYEQVIAENVINSNDDGKIDAIVVSNNDVNVFQIKMSSIPSDSDLTIARENYEEYAKYKKITHGDANGLVKFLNRNFPKYQDKHIKIKTISSKKRSANNYCVDDVYSSFLMNTLLPQESSNITLRLEISKRYDSIMDKSVDNIATSDNNTFLFVNANNLVKNLEKAGIKSKSDKLFYSNVRGSLGDNASMQKTLKDKPENFQLYNNGISIIGCAKMSAAEYIIENPTIINGQQTLINLLSAYEKNIDLSKVVVPVFIKDQNDKEERLNIAKYNNTQKQVKPVDILSLSPDLREIQRHLLDCAIKNNFDEKSFYLRIVTSGSRNSNSAIKKLFGKNRIITVSEFVRSYWIFINKDHLGKWKNNISEMLNKEIIEKDYRFDKNNAERVCKNIREYKDYICNSSSANDYKIADVAMIYLLSDYKIDQVVKIIDYINTIIFNKNGHQLSKKSDIYKSDSVLNDINEAIKELKIQKESC